MAMLDSPLTLALVAVAPTAAAAATQLPIGDPGTMGGLAALTVLAWKVVRLAEKWLTEQSELRTLQLAEWKAQAEHRTAETAYWAARAARYGTSASIAPGDG